jgi:hypothetical protein
MALDWDRIDNLVASFSRPYQQYVCSSAVAFACVWSIITKADATVVGFTTAAAGGLAGTGAYLRSVDKKTQATADIASNRPSPDTTVSAEIK